jgi:hypothetical protein
MFLKMMDIVVARSNDSKEQKDVTMDQQCNKECLVWVTTA